MNSYYLTNPADNRTGLRVEGSASTYHLGFPLKVVNRQGTCITRCTDEAHARRVINSFNAMLDSRTGQSAVARRFQ